MADPEDPTGDQDETSSSMDDPGQGSVTIVRNGVLHTHPPSACAGRHCWVHNPTPSHMMTWAIQWRDDKVTAERVCPHGIGHPDIDDVAYNRSIGRNVTQHACDGCCEGDDEED